MSAERYLTKSIYFIYNPFAVQSTDKMRSKQSENKNTTMDSYESATFDEIEFNAINEVVEDIIATLMIIISKERRSMSLI